MLQMSLLGFQIRSVRIGGRPSVNDVKAARRILADLAAEGEEGVEVEIEIEPKILTDIDVLLGGAFRACAVFQ